MASQSSHGHVQHLMTNLWVPEDNWTRLSDGMNAKDHLVQQIGRVGVEWSLFGVLA